MIGRTIGNFRITRLLGEGAMGAVYEAEHPGIGRRAAVKILHAHLAADPQILNRFFGEARAAHAVRHPGIIEIFDSGPLEGGGAYITMEFLDGESLAARLRRGPLPLPEVIELGAKIADALGAAHARGVIHRDLKPDNIFLLPDEIGLVPAAIKILDFGIAKMEQAHNGVHTLAGTVLGTPLYMSPEQCRGNRDVDHRSDIYSLGVILFEMICGRPPFPPVGFGELTHMHISQPPPSPRSLVPSLPQGIEDALLRAMAKDPDQRFQTMDELRAGIGGARTVVLDAGGGHRGSASSVTTLGASTGALGRERRPSRAPLWLLLSLAGAAAVALVMAQPWSKTIGPLRLPVVAEAPAAPGQPAQSEPPVPAAAEAATPERPTTPPVRTVSVRIDSKPSGARIRRVRDGVLLGETPFEESWRRAEGVEKVTIERSGYRTERLEIPLASGLTHRVQLERAGRARAKARPPSRGPAPTKWDDDAPKKEAPKKETPKKKLTREPQPI